MTLGVAILLASLVGSVHCAAMCGAFTCLYAAGGRADASSHALYNVGRLLAYLALGVTAGAVGAGLDRAAVLAEVQHGAAIVAGLLMIAWAVHAMLVAGGARVAGPPLPAAWRNAMGHAIARVRHRPPGERAFVIGLATTLLPCGWLWVFVVAAAGQGSPVAAAQVMALFWVGTLPMMVTVGMAAQRLGGRWRARLPMASAMLVLALGVLSIGGRLGWPGTQWVHGLTPTLHQH